MICLIKTQYVYFRLRVLFVDSSNSKHWVSLAVVNIELTRLCQPKTSTHRRTLKQKHTSKRRGEDYWYISVVLKSTRRRLMSVLSLVPCTRYPGWWFQSARDSSRSSARCTVVLETVWNACRSRCFEETSRKRDEMSLLCQKRQLQQQRSILLAKLPLMGEKQWGRGHS